VWKFGRGNGQRIIGSPHDASPIGLTGHLLIATRGEFGPGEVRVAIRGGTELFLAYSPQPLPRSSAVLIVGQHGPRGVDVEPWDETLATASFN